MKKKLPQLIEKFDLQTNNPRKLFRAIMDLVEDQMSKRGYGDINSKEPTLDKTAMDDIAEFKGFIEAEKTFSSYVKGRVIAAIIIAVIGILGFSLNQFGLRFYDVPIMFDYIWLVLPIIAVIIALVKAKTKLIISIDLVGESYKYKGQKETQSKDIERRELLDIVSDVRITLKGFPSLNSYFPNEFEDDFKNDLKYINSKIAKEVVPEYRIPST